MVPRNRAGASLDQMRAAAEHRCGQPALIRRTVIAAVARVAVRARAVALGPLRHGHPLGVGEQVPALALAQAGVHAVLERIVRGRAAHGQRVRAPVLDHVHVLGYVYDLLHIAVHDPRRVHRRIAVAVQIVHGHRGYRAHYRRAARVVVQHGVCAAGHVFYREFKVVAVAWAHPAGQAVGRICGAVAVWGVVSRAQIVHDAVRRVFYIVVHISSSAPD